MARKSITLCKTSEKKIQSFIKKVNEFITEDFGQNFNKYSKDSTYEVKAKIIEELSNNSFLIKRLLKAFPNAKDKLNKYRELREQYYKKLKNKYTSLIFYYLCNR